MASHELAEELGPAQQATASVRCVQAWSAPG
jgi:hypothetical protein